MVKIAARVFFGLALLCAVLLAAGFTYEQITLFRDGERYPAPGQLVDVGGRRMHILCRGAAPGPTIVMETGAGDSSYRFWAVQQEVAKFARVCVYDRAGLGWSDSTGEGRSLEDREADLHALLKAANVPPPYVLAAHSMGGLLVRLYARDHRDEVSGMVLISVSEEGLNYGPLAAELNPQTDRFTDVLKEAEWAAQFGLLPLFQKLHPELNSTGGLPENAVAMYARPGTFRMARDDIITNTHRVPPAMQQPGGFGGPLGNLPLIVIQQGMVAPTVPTGLLQAESDSADRLAALSSDSVKVVAAHSRHYIYLSEPEVVIEAIRRVHAAARDATRLNGGSVGAN
jgi:pimeloyl-ACP methyl ester carboxylesterase